jgi:ComF family protein
MNLSSVLEVILDILYPQDILCILCQKRHNDIDDKGLCPVCAETLPYITRPVCQKCGRTVTEDTNIGMECINAQYHFEQAVPVFEYTSEMQRLIHRFKYQGVSYLSRTLGSWMAEAYKQRCRWDVDMIIPVPLHPRRERERGFNQAVLLSREIGKSINVGVNKSTLIRKKHTSTQVGLNKLQRRQNLWDAFEVTEPGKVKDKIILLVDDVFTTGSTVDECSRVLLQAGAKRIYVMTLAAGRFARN